MAHPYVVRRRRAKQPTAVLPTRPLQPETLPSFADRDMRREVRQEFHEADRFGRGR